MRLYYVLLTCNLITPTGPPAGHRPHLGLLWAHCHQPPGRPPRPLIVAAAVFAMIKIMNTAKAKFEKQAAATPPAPAAPPEDVLLLREIRDALKSR